MRQFAIGDVHGCVTALRTLLDRIAPESQDKLVFLGDLIDRGPDSKRVIETILELRNQCIVEAIFGNHEEMLLLSRTEAGLFQAWLSFGGRETLESYGIAFDSNTLRNKEWVKKIPAEHWHFLSADLVDCVEEEGHILVHGAVDPDLPLDKQPWPDLRWARWDDPQRHCSGKITVCGHTHQPSGLPISNGNAICIDTWVYGDGWLTALDLATHRYLQANQSGEVREDEIPRSDVSQNTQ
jgi:serine/threonine protein phosphatase 1